MSRPSRKSAQPSAPPLAGPEFLETGPFRHRSERAKAIAAIVTSAMLFSVMGAAAKAVTRGEDGLPGGEIAFFRYLFGLLAMGALYFAAGVDILGNDRRGLLWRGVYGGFAATLFFLGIQRTSLTNATLLNYTFVIWAPLIAVFSLGERMERRGVLAVATALAGVLLVTRPEGSQIRLGDVLALLSGVLAGAAVVQIRRLRQAESSYAVFFYFNLFGLPVSLATLPLAHEAFRLPVAAQWPLLLVIGATSVAAQLLMTYGYREMTAAQGSLLTLTSLVFSALLANLFFGEALTLATLLGGVLILASAVLLTVQTAKRPAAR